MAAGASVGYKGSVTNSGALTAAFYGDDFTGSTDALTQFHRFGLRGVLLFDCPDRARLAHLAERYDVIGVAGVGRSLPTEQMAAEVGPVLEALQAARPRLVQYKMCSTADSSPRLGSLGRAVELGRRVFGDRPVPILAAQPEFGRYTAFGNHFAVDGAVVHRLDRQPTMSRHPATPMNEADLRIHIGRQTTLPIASVDLTIYELGRDAALERYHAVLAEQPGAVVFDAVTTEHTVRAAGLMFAGRPSEPLFALGSGGLSYGAAAVLAGRRPDPLRFTDSEHSLTPTDQLLVVSGSCSRRTAEQIRHALDHGWVGVPLRVDDEQSTSLGPGTERQMLDTVLPALAAGKSVVVYTSLGAVPRQRSGDALPFIGEAFGAVVRAALDTGVRRVVVAGGDTSGRVMRAIGATAAEVDAIMGVGTVVCRLDAADPVVRGTQVLLKGGQAGPADLFERVRRGRGDDRPTMQSPAEASAEALGIP